MNSFEKRRKTKMSIDAIIAELIKAQEQEKYFEKRVKELKTAVSEYAKNGTYFETDVYIVTIQKGTQKRLDQKKLLSEYPELKDEFPLFVETEKIIPVLKTA